MPRVISTWPVSPRSAVRSSTTREPARFWGVSPRTTRSVLGSRLDSSYKFGSSTTVDLGWEENDLKATGLGGSPHQRWFNLGAKYDFSDKTSFSVLWQISDVQRSERAAAWPTLLNPGTRAGGTQSAKGGLITTQFSVKF